MSLVQATNALVSLTLITMMVVVGLSVTWSELTGVLRQTRLVSAALLANFVLVPAITVALLLTFRSAPLVAVGFLILAVCPGAPFVPPLATVAKGDFAVAVGLMALLSAASTALAPLLLQVSLPRVAGDLALPVDSARLVMTLVVTQLAPLAVGLAVRHVRPALATSWLGPLNPISTGLNLLTVGVILATQYPLLLSIGGRGWLGMTLLLAASLLVGWSLGGAREPIRRSLALTTSMRNIGLSLVIVMGIAPGTAAVTAVLAYGLYGIVGSLLVAVWWSRSPQTTAAGPTSTNPLTEAMS